MSFNQQSVLPAIRSFKDIERLMVSDSFEYIVLLESHIAQLKNFSQMARQNKKKLLIDVDLINGLKNDDYAAEFICQEIKPAGLISTRANVIAMAKKKGLLAIQRLFLLDSAAIEKSYRLFKKTQPDYIEVLPGVVPELITEVHERTGIPVIAGGLIRNRDDIHRAIEAGAVAVTTSDKKLQKQVPTGTKR